MQNQIRLVQIADLWWGVEVIWGDVWDYEPCLPDTKTSAKGCLYLEETVWTWSAGKVNAELLYLSSDDRSSKSISPVKLPFEEILNKHKSNLENMI